MRLLIAITVISFLAFSSLFAADPSQSKSSSACLDNLSIDIDDGVLVLTSRTDEKFVVKITDKDELYVNDKFVETGAEEKELLKKFRNNFIYIIDSAKAVGYEGARIGIKAIAGLVEVACTDLKLAELEVELKKEAESIEREAEELEELADELEALRHELKLRIPELGKLNSF